MACSVIGVPKSEEWNAGVPSNSIAASNQAWGQDFERGTNIKYGDNVIYAYNIKNENKFVSYFTVNSVKSPKN